MTNASETLPTTSTTRLRVAANACAAVALTGAFVAVNIALDASETDPLRRLAISVAILAAVAALTFGIAVPRARRQPSRGRTAMILVTLSVLSLPMFWLGIPAVLALGGLTLDRQRAHQTRSRTDWALLLSCGLVIVAFCVLSLIPTGQ